MAWKSLGKDAVNKNTRSLEWLDRTTPHKLISFRVDPAFHEAIQEYCRNNYISQSELCRYLISREIKGKS